MLETKIQKQAVLKEINEICDPDSLFCFFLIWLMKPKQKQLHKLTVLCLDESVGDK